MRILVIGCGSIGRRHIRLLREMGAEVAGFDLSNESRRAVEETGATFACCDWDEFWHDQHRPKWHGAILATPAGVRRFYFDDIETTVAGILVEKPLASSLHNAQVMCRSQAFLLVGYNLRFHPGLRRVKELLDSGAVGIVRSARIHFGSYLPDWRPGSDYRRGYAAKRESGGGVILDASHELDYACWLFGEPVAVSCVAKNTGALEIETEDVADIVVTFSSGVQAAIHLDYLARPNQRAAVIVGDCGTIEWDWVDQTLWQWSDGEWDCEEHAVERDDMYRAELRHFLACLRGEEQPLCTGEDGLRALRLALAARESAETGRVVRL